MELLGLAGGAVAYGAWQLYAYFDNRGSRVTEALYYVAFAIAVVLLVAFSFAMGYNPPYP